MLIKGMTVKVAHMRLCHSRMPFLRAYPRETHEMVFDAHDRTFAFYKGASVIVTTNLAFVRPHGSLGYKPPAPEVFVPATTARAALQPRPAPLPALASRPTMQALTTS